MRVVAQFLSDLEIRRKPGSRIRELTADLSFYSEELKRVITAPRGFQFNGVSAPLILYGDGEASAGIHDFMYSCPDLYTRAEADSVFRECLRAEGMGAIRRNTWWAGVRAFGWKFYGGRDETSDSDSFGGA